MQHGGARAGGSGLGGCLDPQWTHEEREGRGLLDSPNFIGRDDRIRTCDPLTPSQVRYQAALHPDRSGSISFAHAQRARSRFLPSPSLLNNDEIAYLPCEGGLLAAVRFAAIRVDRVRCGSPVRLTSIPRHLHWEFGGFGFELLKSSLRAAPHDQLNGCCGFLLLWGFAGHLSVLSDAAPADSTTATHHAKMIVILLVNHRFWMMCARAPSARSLRRLSRGMRCDVIQCKRLQRRVSQAERRSFGGRAIDIPFVHLNALDQP